MPSTMSPPPRTRQDKDNSPTPSFPQMFFAATLSDDYTVRVRGYWSSQALAALNFALQHRLAQLPGSGKLRKKISSRLSISLRFHIVNRSEERRVGKECR